MIGSARRGAVRWARRTLVGYGALVLLVNFGMTRAMAETRILALGDSLTAGYGLPAGQGFAAQLQRALTARGHDVRVIDAGVSGDTTAGGLARLDWALADSPQVAIVELGANDALRGLDPDQAYRNLDAIVGALRRKDVRILLVGMVAPANWGPDYTGRFNAIYGRLAEKHGVPLYPFFLDGVAKDPRLNLPDGLHPTADGIGVIVERILPHVEQVIGPKAR